VSPPPRPGPRRPHRRRRRRPDCLGGGAALGVGVGKAERAGGARRHRPGGAGRPRRMGRRRLRLGRRRLPGCRSRSTTPSAPTPLRSSRPCCGGTRRSCSWRRSGPPISWSSAPRPPGPADGGLAARGPRRAAARGYGLIDRPVPDWTARAELTLATAVADALGADAAATVEQGGIEGEPAEVLLQNARDADLLMGGCRGHGGSAGLALGSVSRHAAEHAPCPVAVHHA